MKKAIKKVSPAAFGHLMLEFEDGVKQLVHRTPIRDISMKQFEVMPEVTALTRGPVEGA